MIDEIERSTKKERKWFAWAGDMSDLKRCGRVIEELYDARIESLENERRKRQDENLKSASDVTQGGANTSIAISGNLGYINIVGSPIGDSHEDITRYPFKGLRLTDEDVVTGPTESVLTEVDRRSVRSLTFIGAIDFGEYVIVTFTRTQDWAARVEVRSSNIGWAKQALTRLTDEIEKGVPQWAFMRNSTGNVTVSVRLLTGIIIGASIALMWPNKEQHGNISLGVIFAILSAILLGSAKLKNFLFPAFEISGEARESTGSRRIAALALILISIPIGMFVNLIS
jgi:hypothetical protein